MSHQLPANLAIDWVSPLVLWGFMGMLGWLSFQQPTKSLRLKVLGKKRRMSWAMAGVYVVLYGTVMAWVFHAWYAGESATPFHWIDDWEEWQQLDKMGHAFSTFHLARLVHRYLWEEGFESRWSATMGSITAWLLISPIELLDGFMATYGASWGDLLANSLGCLLFWVQIVYWQRLVFMPKFSFWLSPYGNLRPNVLGHGPLNQFFKDYNGQTYYYTVPLKQLVPWPFIPEWLGVSIGFGGDAMIYGRPSHALAHGVGPGSRQVYLALSIVPEGLLGSDHKPWQRWVTFWLDFWQIGFAYEV